MKKEAFMMDPLLRVRRVSMRFPNRIPPPPLPQVLSYHNQTFLDGELVQDKVAENKYIFRYLVYDIIAFNGKNVMNTNLPERLKIIQNDVIWPRKNQPLLEPYDYATEPFSVRLKDFYEMKHLPYLLEQVIPNIPHPNEGLVFTPLDLPYIPGINKNLIKWKPAHLNSVDFQLAIEWRERKPFYKLNVLDRQTRTTKDFSWIFTNEEDVIAKLSQSDGKIIECIWDPEWKTFLPKKGEETWEEGVWKQGGWRFLRTRPDKKFANDERSIEFIMRSITDNISQEQLLNLLTREERPQKRPRRDNWYPRKGPRHERSEEQEGGAPPQENLQSSTEQISPKNSSSSIRRESISFVKSTDSLDSYSDAGEPRKESDSSAETEGYMPMRQLVDYGADNFTPVESPGRSDGSGSESPRPGSESPHSGSGKEEIPVKRSSLHDLLL